MRLEIIVPHGFCAGVANAVKTANRELERGAGPLYCLHELVHNEMVVDGLKRRGMVFVENIEEVPDGARVLFSAHGVSPEVREKARARHLSVVDATCPFVARVHAEVRKYAECSVKVVIVGHKNHAETIGTAGEMPRPEDVAIVAGEAEVASLPFPPGAKVGVAVQTTMNRDDVSGIISALRRRYPDLAESAAANVCHATEERQRAVGDFAAANPGCGVLVLGSANSSNTRRLEEIARAAGAVWTARAGCEADLVKLEIPPVPVLGVTSGASTPEEFLVCAVEMLGARRARNA